jgi:hypothetical protein
LAEVHAALLGNFNHSLCSTYATLFGAKGLIELQQWICHKTSCISLAQLCHGENNLLNGIIAVD